MTGVLFCLTGFFIYHNYKDAELAIIDVRLETTTADVTGALEHEAEESKTEDLRAYISSYIRNLEGYRLQVFDRAGGTMIGDSVLAQSDTMTTILRASNEKQFQTFRIAHTSYRFIFFPFNMGSRTPVLGEMAVSIHQYNESLEHLRAALYTIIPFLLVILSATCFLITRFAFRPIAKMIATADGIDAQNLHQRLDEPETRDEVNALARTLNKMIHRINEAFDSQKQFIADASHEFRTPLTVITSELELAQSRTTDPSVRESIKISLSEVDRLNKLSADLLLLARIDAAQLKPARAPFILDELLLECIQLIQLSAREKNIQLRVQLDGPVEISADRERLKSVILNLLDNAVRYSAVGTTVMASLMNAPPRIAIADEGPGIAPEHLPHIFKRFYRIDYSRSMSPGNGLGLSIVEHLVTLSGGSVSVESTLGQGTTFLVTLP
jgi:heavy metal sensor kinase